MKKEKLSLGVLVSLGALFASLNVHASTVGRIRASTNQPEACYNDGGMNDPRNTHGQCADCCAQMPASRPTEGWTGYNTLPQHMQNGNIRGEVGKCACARNPGVSIQIPHSGNPVSAPPPTQPGNNIPGQIGIGFPGTVAPQPPTQPGNNTPGQIGIGFPGTGTPSLFQQCSNVIDGFIRAGQSPASHKACDSSNPCQGGAPCLRARFDVDENRRPLPQPLECTQCRPERGTQPPTQPDNNIPGQIGISFPSAPPPPVQQPGNPDQNIPGQIGISFPNS